VLSVVIPSGPVLRAETHEFRLVAVRAGSASGGTKLDDVADITSPIGDPSEEK
jgi:hypothetical protein